MKENGPIDFDAIMDELLAIEAADDEQERVMYFVMSNIPS